MTRSHEDLRNEPPSRTPDQFLDVEIFGELGQRLDLRKEGRLPPEAMPGIIDYYKQLQGEIGRRIKEIEEEVVARFRAGSNVDDFQARRRLSDLETSAREAELRAKQFGVLEKIMQIKREITERERELSVLEGMLNDIVEQDKRTPRSEIDTEYGAGR